MAIDARRHTTLLEGEKPTRAALAAAILSINDVIPVANKTDQAQLATEVAGAGIDPAEAPIVTVRADAPGLHAIEYSFDGSVWLPASGLLHFDSDAARDTWTTANSALLSAGDECVSNGFPCVWSGTEWSGSTWTTLTAAAGWTAGTGSNAPQVCRVGNTIWYRGSLYGGTPNTTAATLPTWARPSRTARVRITLSDGSSGYVRAWSSGAFQPSGSVHDETYVPWPVL